MGHVFRIKMSHSSPHSRLINRNHLVDWINKRIVQLPDLVPILMNEINAHYLPPPINSKVRPLRAAMKNEIDQAGLWNGALIPSQSLALYRSVK